MLVGLHQTLECLSPAGHITYVLVDPTYAIVILSLLRLIIIG